MVESLLLFEGNRGVEGCWKSIVVLLEPVMTHYLSILTSQSFSLLFENRQTFQ